MGPLCGGRTGDSEQEFSQDDTAEEGTVQNPQLRTKFSQLNPRARLNSPQVYGQTQGLSLHFPPGLFLFTVSAS